MVKKEKYVHHFITGVCERVITLNMTSVEVQGGARRLRTMWTPELTQDLQVYHNIDAEAELTNLLSQAVADELDKILENIREMEPIEPEYVDPIQPKRSIMTIGEVTERNQRRVIREQVINKWSNSGLLDGLGLDDYNRENIATLLEGQARALINENTQPENGFDTVDFPIIRQVNPRLIAQDIVPLQPMELPTIDLQYFTTNLEQEVESEMDKITWRTDETWSYENLYGSKIGVKMELRPHDFIKKYRSVFDTDNTIEIIYDGVPEPGNRHENINPLIYREFNTY
jgi:hypothetical protein